MPSESRSDVVDSADTLASNGLRARAPDEGDRGAFDAAAPPQPVMPVTKIATSATLIATRARAMVPAFMRDSLRS
jgi:hypothetical protein